MKVAKRHIDNKSKQWTEQDITDLYDLKSRGYSLQTIGYILDRSPDSIETKLKRLNKDKKKYNAKHVEDKYKTNFEFINLIKPNSILDLFAGENSYYKQINYSYLIDRKPLTITNDINKEFINNTYTNDALKTLCLLYSKNMSFDLIDLDPFGSSYECFDLAIKMSNRGLIITYGELGHLRFKRLDFVNRFYDIHTLSDFTLDKLIEHTKMLGLRNKKELRVVEKKEWFNIARVYYHVRDTKLWINT